MEGESIYALIPQPVIVPAKDPIYISKHDGKKPPTFTTFGLAGTSKPGYKNVAGTDNSLVVGSGHHEYKKPFATMGKEGNARRPHEILVKGSGGGAGAADAAASMQGTLLLPAHTSAALLALLLRAAPATASLLGSSGGDGLREAAALLCAAVWRAERQLPLPLFAEPRACQCAC